MSKLIFVFRELYFWCKMMMWLVEDGFEEVIGVILVGVICYDYDKFLWENFGGNM